MISADSQLVKWEDILDKINGDYGTKEKYCIF